MTVLIPAAPGVPEMWNEPPNWYDSTQLPPHYDQTLDDPRWNGSVSHTFNMGTVEQAAFRGLHNTTGTYSAGAGEWAALYLSFRVERDPLLVDDEEVVYVGVQRPGGTAHVFEIPAFSSVGSEQDQDVAGVTVWQYTGGTWGTITTANPTWVTPSTGFLRAWVTPMGGAVTTNKWAENIRIPLLGTGALDLDNGGVNLGDVSSTPFKFWYGIKIATASGDIYFYWPRTVTIDQNTGDFPDPATWDDAQFATGATTVGGIWFTPSDIGCYYEQDNPASHMGRPPDPSAIGASTTSDTINRLYVDVHNNTGATVTASTVDASFRIANWGTQSDYYSYHVAPGATEWAEIHPEVTKTNAADINDGTDETIVYPWNLTTTEAADWVGASPTKGHHQCMLVTLTAAGANYVFLNDSAYTNMHIVQASVADEDVEFNVKGLEEFAVGNHVPVYVYEERENLVYESAEPINVSGAEFDRLVGGDVQGERIGGLAGRRASYEQIVEHVPSVLYHVFHGTGIKLEHNGQLREVLVPMTSFGALVRHDGPIYGWDVALNVGDITEIAPNWYRVNVPKGGKLKGKLTIRSWEHKRPQGGCLAVLVPFLNWLKKLFK